MATIKAVSITATTTDDNDLIYLVDNLGQLWCGHWVIVNQEDPESRVIVWKIANLPEDQPV